MVDRDTLRRQGYEFVRIDGIREEWIRGSKKIYLTPLPGDTTGKGMVENANGKALTDMEI